MAVPKGDLLYVIGRELLDAAVSVLADAGADPPARKYVDFSPQVLAPVAFGGDCDSQLSVNVGPLTPARMTAIVQGRAGQPSCALRWSCTFTTTLFRCVDMGQALPKPEKVDRLAETALREGWYLARGLAALWHAKELVPSYRFDCEDTQWKPVVASGPQGGLRYWTIPIDVTVSEAYSPR